MIHFQPLEHPAYPSNATLEAEDAADAILAQQRAAEEAWRRLCRRFVDDAEHLIEQMPLGLGIHGYDAPGILSLVRRDFCNFAETTMEDACDGV